VGKVSRSGQRQHARNSHATSLIACLPACLPVPVFLPDKIEKGKEMQKEIPCIEYEYAASAEEKRKVPCVP
jgi:hypothetical protein